MKLKSLATQAQSFISNVIPFSAVILIIGVIIFASMHLGPFILSLYEVDTKKYSRLVDIYNEYPESRPLIKQAFEDGEVSYQEWDVIRRAVGPEGQLATLIESEK
ncbi:hypothetical protein [Vibrio nigripulchritudo]|uniref:hypothetical protein n=1 Tax=Vibrio nigripulchritudo TaxID=28173 RepID=UPI0005FA86DC|nr:hypothetical protein [Vibrio nigripulchritudo]KJY76351.1 hypothetical protein TW74_14910 [Vibrio nigripulchritudo]